MIKAVPVLRAKVYLHQGATVYLEGGAAFINSASRDSKSL